MKDHSARKGPSFGLTEANEYRLRKVLYRAPKGDKWEEKDWDWALKRIARLVKDTRDKDFQTHNAKNELVNRVETIGHYGSSNICNEECWTLSVACRAMGSSISIIRPASDTAHP
jgi:formate dehydrogenase major subunit